MSADIRPRAAAGSARAAWSAMALLITAGVFLVGGAVWYARAATVPLIVAALVATQLLPLVALSARRGVAARPLAPPSPDRAGGTPRRAARPRGRRRHGRRPLDRDRAGLGVHRRAVR